MQIASSARRTCIASVSAVECTATVLMPISWQARWMRSAISPRLAMRTFLIIPSSLDDDERLVVFDGLGVDDEHLAHRTGAGRLDLVHHLHCLDDQQCVAFLDRVAGADERLRARLAGEIDGADHRRLDRPGVAGRGDRGAARLEAA